MLLCAAVLLEFRRFIELMDTESGPAAWLFYWDMETTLPAVMLLLLPVLVFTSRNSACRRSARPTDSGDAAAASTPRVISSCVLLFVLSLFCSWHIGATKVTVPAGFTSQTVRFDELPPAYHDEYSYLLQARTFLDGRLSWPGMTVRPDLFHQFHVLNEHRTLSRYFPWTGCWIAPFEKMGHPYVGHWVAGALSAVFFFLAMIQLATFRQAFAGGLLIAVSPGIAVFSNMLLAHHPTMMALSLFTAASIRMFRTHRLRWAYVAGAGLTLAMLGRPVTAAGFALPFGIRLLVEVWRDRSLLRLLAGFALPLAAGFVVLGIINREATGSWTRTAYQEYTDRYTPRHRFGFGNGDEASTDNGPPAVQAYDKWATNLTFSRAIENVWNRTLASLQWTLAVFPLLLFVLCSLPRIFDRKASPGASGGHPQDTREPSRWLLWLPAASIVSLHVVHIPYWYDGIMHWHYVFETAPLLLLLAGVGAVHCVDVLHRYMAGRYAWSWVILFLAAGLVPGWLQLGVFDNVSKTGAAVSELSFARRRLEIFQRSTADPAIQKPAIILVDERNSDPQLSYVINDPLLRENVVVCRLPETAEEVQQLQRAFPDRTVYSFDPEKMLFQEYSPELYR